MRTESRLTSLYVVAQNRSDAWAGPVKIGISRHPAKRLLSLQSGSYSPLGIYATFACMTPDFARRAEQSAHEHFAGQRLAGEWFAIEPQRAAEHLAICMTVVLGTKLPTLADARYAADLMMSGPCRGEWFPLIEDILAEPRT